MIFLKKGDCLQHTNPYIVAHCCNNKGAFGSGFVASLNNTSATPRKAYLRWKATNNYSSPNGDIPFELGEVQFCYLYNSQIDRTKIVANILGQTLGEDDPQVRYWAIHKGLKKVRDTAPKFISAECYNYDVISPLLGSVLAGGRLEEIVYIIKDIYEHANVNYYLYAYTDEDYTKLVQVAAKFGISV